MDRDRRWPAPSLAIAPSPSTRGAEGTHGPVGRAALERSYADGVTDEFVLPVAIDARRRRHGAAGRPPALLFPTPADRARQISTVFAFADFDGFARFHPRPDLPR